MERPTAEAPSEVDKARHRVLSYYRHLFPGLSQQRSKAEAAGTADSLEAVPTVALDPAFDLTPEAVGKGWTSQPQEFDYELEVEGELPAELHGTLFRNGPGLLDVYGTPLVHPIDGDGMVCAIKFAEGKAHFRSKYVKTTGYVMEKKAQKLIFKGMMGTKPSPTWGEALSEWKEDVMKSKLPGQRFKNPANTNVYYWGGKLLATWESGLPYLLDPATLETKGKDTLNGALNDSHCLAAHFRYDAAADRLVNFSFQLAMSGKCKLFIYEFDRDWKLLSKQVHSFESYYYCHDFLLTENYYIFHQTPFYKLSPTNVAKIISGAYAPGQLMRYYPGNAWEEGTRVHFSSVCIGEKFNMDFEQGMWLSNASAAPGVVHNYAADLTRGTLVRTKADFCSCEFPSVHPDMAGRRWRYAYLMASDSPKKPIPFQEIVKFDREGLGRQVWSARAEFSILGEPVFVPRPGLHREEDDGWVITQLYDCKRHETQFVVLDARNLGHGPVARAKLAHHTPYGFHGTFTPEVFY